jgi:hypothetical protein
MFWDPSPGVPRHHAFSGLLLAQAEVRCRHVVMHAWRKPSGGAETKPLTWGPPTLGEGGMPTSVASGIPPPPPALNACNAPSLQCMGYTVTRTFPRQQHWLNVPLGRPSLWPLLFLVCYRGMKRPAKETGWHRPYTPTHDSISDYAATYTEACVCVPIRRCKKTGRQEPAQQPRGDTRPEDLAPPALPDASRFIL